MNPEQLELGAAIYYPEGSATPISPLPPQPVAVGMKKAVSSVANALRREPSFTSPDFLLPSTQDEKNYNVDGANSQIAQSEQLPSANTGTQATFLLQTPSLHPPNIRLSGPPTQEQSALASLLNTYAFHAFKHTNGVLAFAKNHPITIHAQEQKDTKLNANVPHPLYLQPNIVTVRVASQAATWSHAHFFPQQRKVFLEQLAMNAKQVSIMVRRDTHISTLGELATKLGYEISTFHSPFFPGGLLSTGGPIVTTESIEKHLLTQSRAITVDPRTTQILERVRRIIPDNAYATLHMYGRDQRKKGEFSFESNGRTGVTSVPLTATREKIQKSFSAFNDDYIVVRKTTELYGKLLRDQVAGVISRHQFEKNPDKTPQELLEPFALVPYSESTEPTIIMSQNGVGCVLYHGDRRYSHHTDTNEIWQKASLQSIATSLVDYTQYERRMSVLASLLDDPAQLQRFSFQNTGEAIGISSRINIGNESAHIPMLDFFTPDYEKVTSALRTIGAKGFIVGSGESYHFYGDRLLSKAELVPYYKQMHRDLCGIVDSTHIAFALKKRFACLRLTPSIDRKITQPVYIGEV